MWYKIAASIRISFDIAKYNEFLTILQAAPDLRKKFKELVKEHGQTEALTEAFRAAKPQSGSNPTPPTPSPKPNSTPKPPSTPTPNTTDKDLIPLDQLERRDPNEGPSDLIVRPPGGELDLYKPKKDDDDPKKPKKEGCIIEEEVFIQNLLTDLTGYAQIYFKKKIFTISQDTYRGNTSRFSPAPLQKALGLTPPPGLLPTDPNTQVYDPASATGSPLGDFKRNRGTMTDPFGNPTAVMPVKDKTVVWNTADVQSIMSSLEKIAQMPELQKYGAKEIANILRYPLLQVKSSDTPIDRQILDKVQQIRRYTPLLTNPPIGYTVDSIEKIIKDIRLEIQKLREAEKEEKPDVEVVPFKEFYKLTELSRYYIYKGSQLNGVFCKLESQLITILNNTLNTLGKMEKNKRLKDIYENARGKK
jgi:hypothetical protein